MDRRVAHCEATGCQSNPANLSQTAAMSRRMLLFAKETPRIHWRAVNSDFIVEMGSSGSAAHADGSDDLTLLDLFSNDYKNSAEVGIEGRDAVAMVNHNASAVTRIGLSLNHQPVATCEYIRADAVSDINPWVEGILAAEGVHPLAESGGQSSMDRPDRRDGVGVIDHAGEGVGADPAACAAEAHRPDGAQRVERAVTVGNAGGAGLPGEVQQIRRNLLVASILEPVGHRHLGGKGLKRVQFDIGAADLAFKSVELQLQSLALAADGVVVRHFDQHSRVTCSQSGQHRQTDKAEDKDDGDDVERKLNFSDSTMGAGGDEEGVELVAHVLNHH